MSDTPAEIEKKMLQLFRSLTPEQRMHRGASMFEAGRYFAERAVKARNPGLEGLDLKFAVFRWMYQFDLSSRVLDDVEKWVRARVSAAPHEQQPGA